MTKTKHTPGPWHFDRAFICDGDADRVTYSIRPVGVTCGTIAYVMDGNYAPEANALLIAAAPELLEALEDAEFLLRKLAINPHEAEAMRDSAKRSAEDARAAIRKARGEA